ncbi:MAG: PIN domain-containing protein, partial [Ignavibacteriae bacterium]|nr:PIN domain-containing protein [Ignavibacteriota bacterium]
MNILFIDTNMYLRFFDSSQPEYKKLLKTVVELKDQIFISEQIVAEVNRNKLAVFERSCGDNLTDNELRTRHLPEHFDSKTDNAISDWNKSRKELQEQSEKLIDKQNEIFRTILNQISTSSDEVSKSLAPLFSLAQKPSNVELEQAKARKLLGNPPGKPQDPLGDQITWEQFLNRISTATAIWIASGDYDYLTTYKNQCYLNAFLHAEIIGKSKNKPKIYCFNRLSECLKHLNKASPRELTSLPKDDELKEISKLDDLPPILRTQRKATILVAEGGPQWKESRNGISMT